MQMRWQTLKSLNGMACSFSFMRLDRADTRAAGITEAI